MQHLSKDEYGGPIVIMPVVKVRKRKDYHLEGLGSECVPVASLLRVGLVEPHDNEDSDQMMICYLTG